MTGIVQTRWQSSYPRAWDQLRGLSRPLPHRLLLNAVTSVIVVLLLVVSPALAQDVKTITYSNSRVADTTVTVTLTINPLPAAIEAGSQLQVTFPNCGYSLQSDTHEIEVDSQVTPLSNVSVVANTLTFSLPPSIPLPEQGTLLCRFRMRLPFYSFEASTTDLTITHPSSDPVTITGVAVQGLNPAENEINTVYSSYCGLAPSPAGTPGQGAGAGLPCTMYLFFQSPVSINNGGHMEVEFPGELTLNSPSSTACSVSTLQLTGTPMTSDEGLPYVRVPWTGNLQTGRYYITCTNLVQIPYATSVMPTKIRMYNNGGQLVGITNTRFSAVAPNALTFEEITTSENKTGVMTTLDITLSSVLTAHEEGSTFQLNLPASYSAAISGHTVTCTLEQQEESEGEFVLYGNVVEVIDSTTVTIKLARSLPATANTDLKTRLTCSGLRNPRAVISEEDAECITITTYAPLGLRQIAATPCISQPHIEASELGTYLRELTHSKTTTATPGVFTLRFSPLVTQLTPGDKIQFYFPITFSVNHPSLACTVKHNGVDIEVSSTLGYTDSAGVQNDITVTINGIMEPTEAGEITEVACTPVSNPVYVISPDTLGTLGKFRTLSPQGTLRDFAPTLPSPGTVPGVVGFERSAVVPFDFREGTTTTLLVEIIGFGAPLTVDSVLSFEVSDKWELLNSPTTNSINVYVNSERISAVEGAYILQYSKLEDGPHKFDLTFKHQDAVPRGVRSSVHITIPNARTTTLFAEESGFDLRTIAKARDGGNPLHDVATGTKMVMIPVYPGSGVNSGLGSAIATLGSTLITSVTTLTLTYENLGANLRENDRCHIRLSSSLFKFVNTTSNPVTEACTLSFGDNESSAVIKDFNGTSSEITFIVGATSKNGVTNADVGLGGTITISCQSIQLPQASTLDSNVGMYCDRPINTKNYIAQAALGTLGNRTYRGIVADFVSTTLPKTVIAPLNLEQFFVTPGSLFGGESDHVDVTFTSFHTDFLGDEYINVTFPGEDFEAQPGGVKCRLFDGEEQKPFFPSDQVSFIRDSQIIASLRNHPTQGRVPFNNNLVKKLACDGIRTKNSYRPSSNKIYIETFDSNMLPKEYTPANQRAYMPLISGTMITPTVFLYSSWDAPNLLYLTLSTSFPDPLAPTDVVVFSLPDPWVWVPDDNGNINVTITFTPTDTSYSPQSIEYSVNFDPSSPKMLRVEVGETIQPGTLVLDTKTHLDALTNLAYRTPLTLTGVELKILRPDAPDDILYAGLPTPAFVRWDQPRAIMGKLKLSGLNMNLLTTEEARNNFMAKLGEEVQFAASVSTSLFTALRSYWEDVEGRENEDGEGMPLVAIRNFNIADGVEVDYYLQLMDRTLGHHNPTPAQVADAVSSMKLLIEGAKTMPNFETAEYFKNIDNFWVEPTPIYRPTPIAEYWPGALHLDKVILSSGMDEIYFDFSANTAQPALGTLKRTITLKSTGQAHEWHSCDSILSFETFNTLVEDSEEQYLDLIDAYELNLTAAADLFDGPWCRWASPSRLAVTTVDPSTQFRVLVGEELSLRPDVELFAADISSPPCVLQPCVSSSVAITISQPLTIPPEVTELPSVSLAAPRFSPHCMGIQIDGTGTKGGRGRKLSYTWALVNVAPADSNPTPDVAQLEELLANSKESSIVISPDVLAPNVDYTFSLKATQWTGEDDMNEITVHIAENPVPLVQLPSQITFDPALASALGEKLVVTPVISKLDSACFDDGADTNPQYLWDFVGGPATVSLTSAAKTLASLVVEPSKFTAPGNYEFKVTAQFPQSSLIELTTVVTVPPPKTPAVTGVKLFSNGRGLTIEFDVATNYFDLDPLEASVPSVPVCEEAFPSAQVAAFYTSGDGAVAPHCAFTSPSTLVVHFGSNPTITLGQTVTLKGGLKSLDGQSPETNEGDLVGTLAPPSASFTSTAPVIRIIPVAPLSECTPEVILDAEALSAGGLGRPLRFTWTLSSILDAEGAVASVISTINSYISSTFDPNGVGVHPGKIKIPGALFSIAGTYQFSITARNWIDQVAFESFNVVRSSNDIPVVRAVGPTQFRTYSTAPIYVPIEVVRAGCATDAAVDSPDWSAHYELGFKWTYVPVQGQTLFDPIANTSRKALYIKENTLPAGATYKFELTTSLRRKATNAVTTSVLSVDITAVSSPLVAVIAGGAERTISLSGLLPSATALTLNASASFDPNDPSATLYYSWSCYSIPSGLPCSFISDTSMPELPTSPSMTESSLIVPAGALSATDPTIDESYEFRVTITSTGRGSSGLSATSSQRVRVTSAPIPEVEVQLVSRDTGVATTAVQQVLPTSPLLARCRVRWNGSLLPLGTTTLGANSFSFQWKLRNTVTGSDVPLDDKLQAGTPTTPSITIKPGIIKGNSVYKLQCEVSVTTAGAMIATEMTPQSHPSLPLATQLEDHSEGASNEGDPTVDRFTKVYGCDAAVQVPRADQISLRPAPSVLNERPESDFVASPSSWYTLDESTPAGAAALSLPATPEPYGGSCVGPASAVDWDASDLEIRCEGWTYDGDGALDNPALRYRLSVTVPTNITHVVVPPLDITTTPVAASDVSPGTLGAPLLVYISDFQPGSKFDLGLLPFATDIDDVTSAQPDPTTLTFHVEIAAPSGAATIVDVPITVQPPAVANVDSAYIDSIRANQLAAARSNLVAGDASGYSLTAMAALSIISPVYIINESLDDQEVESRKAAADELRRDVIRAQARLKGLQLGAPTSENEQRHLILTTMVLASSVRINTMWTSLWAMSDLHDTITRMCSSRVTMTPAVARAMLNGISEGFASITNAMTTSLADAEARRTARDLLLLTLRCLPRMLLSDKVPGESVELRSPFFYLYAERDRGPNPFVSREYTVPANVFMQTAEEVGYPEEITVQPGSLAEYVPQNEVMKFTTPASLFNGLPTTDVNPTSVIDVVLSLVNENFFDRTGSNSSLVVSQVAELSFWAGEKHLAVQNTGPSLEFVSEPSQDDISRNIHITIPRVSLDPSVYENYTHACQYWDTGRNEWKLTGCAFLTSTATSVTCACNHLTVYASSVIPPLAVPEPRNLYTFTFDNVLERPTAFATGAIIAAVPFILWFIAFLRDDVLQERAVTAVWEALYAVKCSGIMFPFKYFERELRWRRLVSESMASKVKFFFNTVIANHLWFFFFRHKFSPLTSQMRVFILSFNVMGIFMFTAAFIQGAGSPTSGSVWGFGIAAAVLMAIPTALLVNRLSVQDRNLFFEFVNQVFIDVKALQKIQAARKAREAKARAKKRKAQMDSEVQDELDEALSGSLGPVELRAIDGYYGAELGTGRLVPPEDRADTFGEAYRQTWATNREEHIRRLVAQRARVDENHSLVNWYVRMINWRDFLSWSYVGLLPPHLFTRFVPQECFWSDASNVDPDELWMMWNSRPTLSKVSLRTLLAFWLIIAMNVVFWICMCAAAVKFDNSGEVASTFVYSGIVGLVFDILVIEPLIVALYFAIQKLLEKLATHGADQEILEDLANLECIELARLVAHLPFDDTKLQIAVLRTATQDILDKVSAAEIYAANQRGEDVEAELEKIRSAIENDPDKRGEETKISDLSLETPKGHLSEAGRRLSLYTEANAASPLSAAHTQQGFGVSSPLTNVGRSRHSFFVPDDPTTKAALEAAAAASQSRRQRRASLAAGEVDPAVANDPAMAAALASALFEAERKKDHATTDDVVIEMTSLAKSQEPRLRHESQRPVTQLTNITEEAATEQQPRLMNQGQPERLVPHPGVATRGGSVLARSGGRVLIRVARPSTATTYREGLVPESTARAIAASAQITNIPINPGAPVPPILAGAEASNPQPGPASNAPRGRVIRRVIVRRPGARPDQRQSAGEPVPSTEATQGEPATESQQSVSAAAGQLHEHLAAPNSDAAATQASQSEVVNGPHAGVSLQQQQQHLPHQNQEQQQQQQQPQQQQRQPQQQQQQQQQQLNTTTPTQTQGISTDNAATLSEPTVKETIQVSKVEGLAPVRIILNPSRDSQNGSDDEEEDDEEEDDEAGRSGHAIDKASAAVVASGFSQPEGESKSAVSRSDQAHEVESAGRPSGAGQIQQLASARFTMPLPSGRGSITQNSRRTSNPPVGQTDFSSFITGVPSQSSTTATTVPTRKPRTVVDGTKQSPNGEMNDGPQPDDV